MDMRQYLSSLSAWADGRSIKLDASMDEKIDHASIRAVAKLHRDISCLYGSFNSIFVRWSTSDKRCGRLYLMPPSDIVELHESSANHGYSDKDVLASGFSPKWWKENLSVFRRLVMFYDEGNGDGLFVDRDDGAVYFLAHDWMDWISKEPPMALVGRSIDEVYGRWADIGFARPKNLYWMNAIKNGRFSGFNNSGFYIV